MAQAPSVLSGFLGLEGLLADGTLDERVRAQVALVVAEVGQSEYCLAAHVALALQIGLTPQEISEARRARSSNQKVAAMLCLARACVVRRGELDPTSIADARAAGVTDPELLELVAQVCFQVFGNYIAHLTDIPPDYPMVALGELLEGT